LAFKRALKSAADTGKLLGEVYGLVLGQANSDMQALTSKSDGWLVKLYRQNRGSVDDIMAEVAARLESLPEFPEYEDPRIAIAAADAFDKAYGGAVAQIDAEVYLLEATQAAVEVALMEAALGPMGGAAALRAALSRLRNIPIFIPGTVGSVGGFYRIAAATTRTIVKPSARRLAAAMKRAGIFRPNNTVPHHIVAHGAKSAKETVKILERFGIGVDDAANGVYLPPTEELAKKMGSTAHNTLHTHKYYEKVYEELRHLTSSEQVERQLQSIAKRLMDGVFM
jgi:hypothetical protein